MPVLFVGMNFVPWDASVASIALPIYVTCLAAGVVVGLIHGAFLLRMTSINELAQSI
jgi:Na+/glutamate symporter